MQVMYDDYGDNGYVPLAVNLGEDMESVVKTYARQYTYPYLRDGGSVWATYKQGNSIPLNYVIDATGIIRYIAVGWNEQAVRDAIKQWLPNPIDHDVGVKLILAPLGSLDSAQVVVPACSVYNYASNAETYPVRMRIGTDYDTTVTVSSHQPGTAQYVQFPAWTALKRGPSAVTCTTELSGDDIKSNNAATGLVTVYVYDLALTAILAPPDTVDSGAVVAPSAVVENLGNWADMAKVKFYIGDFYVDSLNVPLQPGRSDTANLRGWTAAQVGTFPVRCSVSGRKDMILGNNLLTRTVTVVRSPGIEERTSSMAGFALYQARPNPARPQAVIRYSVAYAVPVDLRVYSAGGELVRTLRSGVEPAGRHSVVWDGRDDAGRAAGQGVYYCRLAAGRFLAVRKLVKAE